MHLSCLYPLVFGLLWWSVTSQQFDYQWRTGRATFYGTDAWSIHYGSCGYYNLDPCTGTGWDIAALSDTFHAYSGSCGSCYEVACDNRAFKDGYGEFLDRNNVCSDSAASVVVTVTDTCPCNYPNNYHSNKRWCCGDVDHFDLSVYAFEKLASTKWGVIGIKYRPVPCYHNPWKKPKPLEPPSPPAGLNWGKWHNADAANCLAYQNMGEGYNAAEGGGLGIGGEAINVTDYIDPGFTPSPPPVKVYEGKLAKGWRDWSFEQTTIRNTSGIGKNGKAKCGSVRPGGALNFVGPLGVFTNRSSLEIWVKHAPKQPPKGINLEIASKQGTCKPVPMEKLVSSRSSKGFHQYMVALPTFKWTPSNVTRREPGPFLGCADWVVVQNITTIRVRNRSGSKQNICVDDVIIL